MRASAEIDWGKNPRDIAFVGQRALHQYWPLLAPYFRDLLLAPQRRSGEEVVAWTWLEVPGGGAASAQELVALRERLLREQQWFADGMARSAAGEAENSGLRSQAASDHLQAVMADVVAGLVAKSDGELTPYVCRTSGGLRLHSWGAKHAARPHFFEACEIGGIVVIDGKPTEGLEIGLESSAGNTLAQTRSDRLGRFGFQKTTPGRYRIRVRSDHADFPAAGVPILLDHESIIGLEIAGISSGSNPLGPIAQGEAAMPGNHRRIRRLIIGLMVLICLATGWKRWGTELTSAGISNANSAPARGGIFTLQAPTKSSPGQSVAVHPSEKGGAISSHAELSPVGLDDAEGMGSRIATNEAARIKRDLAPYARASRSLRDTSSPNSVKSNHVADGSAPKSAVEVKTEIAMPADASLPPELSGAPIPLGSLPGASPVGPPSQPSENINGAAMAGLFRQSAGASPPASSAEKPPSAGSVAPVMPPVANVKVNVVSLSANVVAGPSKLVAFPATKDNVSNHSSQSVPFTGNTIDPEKKVAVDADVGAIPSVTHQSHGHPVSAVGSKPKDLRAWANWVKSSAETPVKATTLADPPELIRAVKVHVSPWRTRLLRDAILPTMPMLVGSRDEVGTLRTNLKRECETTCPADFVRVTVTHGYAIGITGNPETAGLRWERTLLSSKRVTALAVGNHAEVTWPDEDTPVGATLELIDASDRTLARITIGPNGESLMEAWSWISVRKRIVIGLSSESGKVPCSRLAWQRASGQPLPSSWRQYITGEGKTICALEVPLQDGPSELACALFDRDSGWALVGEISQTTVMGRRQWR